MSGRNHSHRSPSRAAFFALGVLLYILPEECISQQKIAHVQPDALAPDMTIAMEVLAPATDSGAFGADGIYLPSQKISFVTPADSFSIIFGPVVISWNGRVLQVPVMAKPDAVPHIVSFQILNGNKKSLPAQFEILLPHSKISIHSIGGMYSLGDGSTISYSFGGKGNTIVADGLELLGDGIFDRSIFNFSTANNDSLEIGNPHYHPVTLLVRGPISMNFSEISVSADSLNGGPGGGGGGHGFSGTGGAGYTGGGSDSNYSPANIGSGGNSTITHGGPSSTGILGGASTDSLADHGGGGGTGCPYGSSGIFSEGNDTGKAGGFGGASAGGQTVGHPFGGGGGAFGTNGNNGAGLGANGGHSYGGRFLVPMQGGSGGGAGNHVSIMDSSAGSGGGGGGALSIICNDAVTLTGSFITANGAKGVSGVTAEDAGGGGGSGGGILLGARKGVTMSTTQIAAYGGNSGSGGTGADQTASGGAGGAGRIRIDGEIQAPLPNNNITTALVSGPTLDLPINQLQGPFALFTGTAGDSVTLTDSVRIYYRNKHSSWKFFDTLRFKINGKFRWQAYLPTGHDSSLFITVMSQVKNPTRAFANFEPVRLVSHLSSAIIPVNPTPHLVLLQDTLDFGCHPADGTCVQASFYLSNLGEDSVRFTSITISNPNFKIVPPIHNLGYYKTDSIILQYCPSKVGNDIGVISFNSNDTLRKAILVGCGTARDNRITLKPAALDFGRVGVGKCDTLKVIARSIGRDSVLINPNGFVHPPFAIIDLQSPVLLAPKDSLPITISFCPTDTGAFLSSFILTDKRDSIKVIGIGTRKILIAQASFNAGRICIGTCDTVKLKFSSEGNDAVHITNISGASFTVPPPFSIPQLTDTEFTIRFCPMISGDSSITVTYTTDADSATKTIIHYHGIHPSVHSDTALHFNQICTGSSISLPITIQKIGADSITIVSAKLKNPPFTISGDSLPRMDSAHFTVTFSSQTAGNFSDTLFALVHLGICGDTLLAIPVSGSAIDQNLQFSKNEISFGIVDTGSCKVDSVIVTNLCTNAANITIANIAAPFTIVSPGNSFSLAASGSAVVIFRYCPAIVGSDSASALFRTTASSFALALHGAGQARIDSPFIRFKLPTIDALAGKEFSFPITVDSISSTAKITSVQGSLEYDPMAVEPVSISSPKWSNANGAESSPGFFDFSASGTSSLAAGDVLATIQMIALYSLHDTTSVFLDSLKFINYAQSSAIPGFVKIVACGNLPGNVIIAGDYSLGNPSPNPSTGNLNIPVTLGVDGILHIRMYNASGAIAIEKNFQLKRGEHTLTLDVSSLPSGMYYVNADSWNWRDGKVLVIEK